jgi:hypothetical protein
MASFENNLNWTFYVILQFSKLFSTQIESQILLKPDYEWTDIMAYFFSFLTFVTGESGIFVQCLPSSASME